MRLLGIESSCSETAVSVVEDGRRMLSSVIASRVLERRKLSSVTLEIASRHHAEATIGVVQQALGDAGTNIKEPDMIAVTVAPGLIGAPLVGVNSAKGLSFASGVPLVPVHHLCSHVAANYLMSASLEPPFSCLAVSDGHTYIVRVTDYTELRVLGYMCDDAAGEALDEAAHVMDLPYPGGIFLDEEAELGNPNAFSLPYSSVDGAPFDFSLSRLRTAIIDLIHNATQKGDKPPRTDLAASFHRVMVDCLVRNVVAAIREAKERWLVIAGGVSADSLLRHELERICGENGWEFYRPELSLCGDSAAMMASQGYYEFLAGRRAGLTLNVLATMDIQLNFEVWEPIVAPCVKTGIFSSVFGGGENERALLGKVSTGLEKVGRQCFSRDSLNELNRYSVCFLVDNPQISIDS